MGFSGDDGSDSLDLDLHLDELNASLTMNHWNCSDLAVGRHPFPRMP